MKYGDFQRSQGTETTRLGNHGNERSTSHRVRIALEVLTKVQERFEAPGDGDFGSPDSSVGWWIIESGDHSMTMVEDLMVTMVHWMTIEWPWLKKLIWCWETDFMLRNWFSMFSQHKISIHSMVEGADFYVEEYFYWLMKNHFTGWWTSSSSETGWSFNWFIDKCSASVSAKILHFSLLRSSEFVSPFSTKKSTFRNPSSIFHLGERTIQAFGGPY